MPEPFVQGRFDELPALPRRPHAYDRAEARAVRVASRLFGDVEVHVRTFGSGPPLLLIHGFMTTSYSWRYAFEPLGQHFTCIAPDLPGAGRSSKPLHVSYEPDRLAVFLTELQRALDIVGCPVIGNSMGGYLAMHMALGEPASMSRLVVLHAPGIPEARLEAARLALALPGSHRLLHWMVARDPWRWAHRNVHYYDESLKSVEEAREYGDPLATYEGRQAFLLHLRDTMGIGPMRRFHRRLRARHQRPFPVPLLLLYARADPMVPPRFGSEFARLIPSAELQWLERGSHFAHVDATDAFAERALAFLT